jgi:hypothetical protein
MNRSVTVYNSANVPKVATYETSEGNQPTIHQHILTVFSKI